MKTWIYIAIAFGAMILIGISGGILPITNETQFMNAGDTGVISYENDSDNVIVWYNEQKLRNWVRALEIDDMYEVDRIWEEERKNWGLWSINSGTNILILDGGSIIELDNGIKRKIYHIRLLEGYYAKQDVYVLDIYVKEK